MPKKGGAAKQKAFELAKLPAYKQAKQLYNQGEDKQALSMFERALKKVPARTSSCAPSAGATCGTLLPASEGLNAGAEGGDHGDGGGQDSRDGVGQPRQCALQPEAVVRGGDQLREGAGGGRAGHRAGGRRP